MSPLNLPWSVLADYRCFGCSPHNEGGLRLVFEPHPDGICARFQLGRHFESYPGIVHGGLVGTICDETMGNLIVLRRRQSALTVSLRQRFITPLAIGRPYACVARLRGDADTGTGEDGQPLYRASADVLDDDGLVCATAAGSYRPFPLADVRARLALSEAEIATLSRALSGDRSGQ
jgi:acyl-coenzyme A thioesterase PaaI-like protein